MKRSLTVVFWRSVDRHGNTIIISVDDSCMRVLLSQILQFLLEVVIVILEEGIIRLETPGSFVIRRFISALKHS